MIGSCEKTISTLKSTDRGDRASNSVFRSSISSMSSSHWIARRIRMVMLVLCRVTETMRKFWEITPSNAWVRHSASRCSSVMLSLIVLLCSQFGAAECLLASRSTRGVSVYAGNLTSPGCVTAEEHFDGGGDNCFPFPFVGGRFAVHDHGPECEGSQQADELQGGGFCVRVD